MVQSPAHNGTSSTHEPTHSVISPRRGYFVGLTITTLQTQITAALTAELATVREAIADGTEQAPTLETPVVGGTTYPAIRRVIDEAVTTHDRVLSF